MTLQWILNRIQSRKLLTGLFFGFIALAMTGGVVLGMIWNNSDILQDVKSSGISDGYDGNNSGKMSGDSISSSDLQEMDSNLPTSNGTSVSPYNSINPDCKDSGISSSNKSTSDSTSIFTSSTSSSVSSNSGIIGNELIQDTEFLRGFAVKGLSTITDGSATVGYFDYDGDSSIKSTNPVWDLAAWYSGYSIGKTNIFTKLANGYYRYEDTNKKVTINTNESSISLRLDASKYYTAPRKAGENWPHLLIGQGGRDYSDTDYFKQRKIDQMKELRVSFDTKLVYFNDAMGENANPGLHGCGFYNYLYIQDLNRNGPGYGQMIWFGLPMFDNRTAWCPEYGAADGGKADASGMFIYQIPQNNFMPDTFWKNGKPSPSENNSWIHVSFDCLPFVQRALTMAHERNYMSDTSWDELYFNGLNIGWEMYGTYDGEIAVKNYQILAVPR